MQQVANLTLCKIMVDDNFDNRPLGRCCNSIKKVHDDDDVGNLGRKQLWESVTDGWGLSYRGHRQKTAACQCLIIQMPCLRIKKLDFVLTIIGNDDVESLHSAGPPLLSVPMLLTGCAMMIKARTPARHSQTSLRTNHDEQHPTTFQTHPTALLRSNSFFSKRIWFPLKSQTSFST